MKDSESSLKFSEAENKIRKKWLFTTLPEIFLRCFIIISIFGDFTPSNVMMTRLIFLLSLASVGGAYMNYYCAYKNPGTILPLLWMIVISLNLLFFSFFLILKNLALINVPLILLLCMLVLFVFEFATFYYSYNLRKINKEMKKRILTTSSVYINAISIFSTATNLEELNQQFSRLKTLDDLGSAVEALAEAYAQQKKKLTLTKNSFE